MWSKFPKEIHPPLFQKCLIWQEFSINTVTIQTGLQLKGCSPQLPKVAKRTVGWVGTSQGLHLGSDEAPTQPAASPLETLSFESQGASLEKF